MAETHNALVGIHQGFTDSVDDPKLLADKQIGSIKSGFPDALVDGFEKLQATLEIGNTLPNQNDCHVLAAAVKCRASIIVTENMSDFPTMKSAVFY